MDVKKTLTKLTEESLFTGANYIEVKQKLEILLGNKYDL